MNSTIRIKGTRVDAPFTYEAEINLDVDSFWIYAVPDEEVFHAQRFTVAGATMLSLDLEGALLEMESQFQERVELPPVNLNGIPAVDGLPLLEIEDANYAAVSLTETGFFTWFVDNIGVIDQVMIWGNVSFLATNGLLVGIRVVAEE